MRQAQNSGTISVLTGIKVSSVTNFSSGISNSGTIAQGRGHIARRLAPVGCHHFRLLQQAECDLRMLKVQQSSPGRSAHFKVNPPVPLSTLRRDRRASLYRRHT
jgi:hypothetical protein